MTEHKHKKKFLFAIKYSFIFCILLGGCQPAENFPYYPSTLRQANKKIDFCVTLTEKQSKNIVGFLHSKASLRGWKSAYDRTISSQGSRELFFYKDIKGILWRKPKMTVVKILIKKDPFKGFFYEVCYHHFYLPYPCLVKSFPLPVECCGKKRELSPQEVYIEMTPACRKNLKEYGQNYFLLYGWQRCSEWTSKVEEFVNIKSGNRAVVSKDISGKGMVIRIEEATVVE